MADLVCKLCGGTSVIKAGMFPDGSQRHKCTACNSYKISEDTGNILIIPDIHLPFEHSNALEFLKGIKEKYGVSNNNVYSVGDIFDNNGINFHEKDPDGLGIKAEMDSVRGKLQEWYKVFPVLKIADANHCRLPARKAKAIGLPSVFVKGLLEVYDAPKEWEYRHQWNINDSTILIHGDGFSGKYGCARAAESLQTNVVMGHLHSNGAIFFSNTEHGGLTWGMSVGALIDHTKYAFNYAKYFPRKPIPGCGIITKDGMPILEIMK